MTTFQTSEKHLSQIPALQLLIGLGYEFLTPSDAFRERQGRYSNVLLENILRNQLKEINRIRYRGSDYLFSEENLQSAIQKLKSVKYDGLLKTNEAVYDLLTLGTAMEQNLEGDSKSFNINYIDWSKPSRNKFHVTVEYSVERSRSSETVRPDIVLFVNGIPLCVIECKAPQVELEQAVSQSIRNQNEEHIPKLFVYSQLLLALNKNAAKYATTGTSAKFWSQWKEQGMNEGGTEHTKLLAIIKQSLSAEQISQISSTFNVKPSTIIEERLHTKQDSALFSLCRPERLIELAWKFTVFDNGIKKIARYQQYFVVKSTMNRVRQLNSDNRRRGGMIWHTQGSGKSLSMVMLVRNLALGREFSNPRIVLVTDRRDLDKQLRNTFEACGLEAIRARSGKHLLELVLEKQSRIITTLIHKFDSLQKHRTYQDESSNIFVLVDESHRTQFGRFSARMRQFFPNACYLGFTGTPLLKAEKNSFAKFGELIQPHYSIDQAVEDGTVVPLLYEGRHVELEQNKKAVDLWFERHTQGLTKDQQADLKRKYSRSEMLNKTDRVVYMRAFDISEHFRSNWQGTGFKAQLVAPDKASAIKYHSYLQEIGYVSSEVVISAPDMREGFEEIDDESKTEVAKFWQKMMRRHGNSEDLYNKQIIDQFKYSNNPEILIVVDKLLTGFDAPRNTVLYLCRTLTEHSLLQAIARVNRVYEGKEFGFIVDYANILGELDKAFTMYNALEGFDEIDLLGTLTSINTIIDNLATLHSDLWDIFKTVKNVYDEEDYEVHLADDEIREEFYDRFWKFAKALGIALSSEKFLNTTNENTLSRYKEDLRKFQALKASVKLRYAESIDYRDFEPKIKKLLDTHIQANEVIQIHEPVNIFDTEAFTMVKQGLEVYGSNKTTESRADSIAHATKKVLSEKMDEDPAFYAKFSELIQEAIDNFRNKRISALEYLNTIVDYSERVAAKKYDYVPEKLNGKEDAMAYFGVLKPLFEKQAMNAETLESLTADSAIAIYDIIAGYMKVQFWDDEDAQKQVHNKIDDYLFDELRKNRGIELSTEQMDEIISKVMQLAKHRSLR